MNGRPPTAISSAFGGLRVPLILEVWTYAGNRRIALGSRRKRRYRARSHEIHRMTTAAARPSGRESASQVRRARPPSPRITLPICWKLYGVVYSRLVGSKSKCSPQMHRGTRGNQIRSILSPRCLRVTIALNLFVDKRPLLAI